MHLFADIEINGTYMQLQVGSTSTINCTVNNYDAGVSTINWLLQNGSVVSSSRVLTLQQVDYFINGREFTCSLNLSHWPYRINKVITATVKG